MLGVAVTGSGRHLAAQLLGADLVKNEITCQLRAAVEIAPDVDTIFEIGGQDSKYIHVRDGHIDDFVMNKICAAGTGSFLEEQADHLGVAIVDEFSRLAAASTAPADLGCQCTVFMHSEVVAAQRRGASTPDLCAGLAYSVARNYLDRVVAGRPVGRSIMFQGGVASNPSVVAAFRQILGIPVRVHPYAKVSGAIGAALLVRGDPAGRDLLPRLRRLPRPGSGVLRVPGMREPLPGESDAHRSSIRSTSATPASGTRAAPVMPATSCPTSSRVGRKSSSPTSRLRLEPRGRIGIPRASTLLDQLPFWAPFFARLGYEVVASQPSSQATLQAGLRRLPAETCLPIKLAFGHVQELVEAGVDHIFLPSILTLAGRRRAVLPFLPLRPGRALHDQGGALGVAADARGSPRRAARTRSLRDWRRRWPSWASAGTRSPKPTARRQPPGRNSVAAWSMPVARCSTALDRAIVVIGKPYNVLDPYLNLNLLEALETSGRDGDSDVRFCRSRTSHSTRRPIGFPGT